MRWVLALLVLLLSVPVFGGHVEKVPGVVAPSGVVATRLHGDAGGGAWFVTFTFALLPTHNIYEVWCLTSAAIDLSKSFSRVTGAPSVARQITAANAEGCASSGWCEVWAVDEDATHSGSDSKEVSLSRGTVFSTGFGIASEADTDKYEQCIALVSER